MEMDKKKQSNFTELSRWDIQDHWLELMDLHKTIYLPNNKHLMDRFVKTFGEPNDTDK
jgi:hypothetical protein